MYFLWPEVLWSLLLLPVLVLGYRWLLRRRRKVAVRYPSLLLIRPAMGHGQRFRRHIPPALLLSALAAALVGAARPSAEVVLPADYLTLVLAMDVSRSMLAQDVKPSRIEASQAAVKDFLQELPPDVRVGVVSFAGNAQLVQQVTDNKEALIASIDRFQLQRGTATGSGLLVALNTLLPDAGVDLEATLFGRDFGAYGGAAAGQSLDQRKAKPPPKQRAAVAVGSYTGGAIVLLSDGRRTTGPDPLEAAKLAASLGVRVYTVAFGTAEGVIPGMEGWSFYARVDEESLKAMAKITGAEFFRASNAADLKNVYEHLSSKFTLERRATEVSSLFAGLCLLLVLSAMGLSLHWHRR
jgi:Ca-activated chloride channel family protein